MGGVYSMFSRKRTDTEDRAMAELPDDLGIPMKPARPPGQPATVAPLSRNAAPVPPRTPEGARPAAADMPRPSEAPRRGPEPAAAPAPAAAALRRSETDVRTRSEERRVG